MTPSQLLLITAYGQSREAKEDAKLNLIADEVIRQVAQNSLSRMQDFEAPEGERLALINLLGCDIIPTEQAMTMIAQLIDARQLPSIQEAALLAARRLNSPIVATTLVEAWPKMTPEARLVASATMLTRKAWVNQLLTALEQDKIRTVDLDAATIQQLTSYGDRSIRNRCEAVFGKPSSRAAVVARYMQEMPKEGDVARGEKLFTENCAVCHRPPEGKSMIGPPIDNLGHWNIEQWVTAIMDPNRAIEPKFHQYTVLTDDGQVLAGVIQQRSAQSVRLASADGSQREVTLESIEEIRDSGVSLMPEGLETKLSPADLAALIAFLRSR